METSTLKRAMKYVQKKREKLKEAQEDLDNAELKLEKSFEIFFDHRCVADCGDDWEGNEYVVLHFKEEEYAGRVFGKLMEISNHCESICESMNELDYRVYFD